MPKRPKSLIFCVHAHQPVGNFNNVFEEAYQKSYRPFFEVVDRHPLVPIACHFSGSLIDWLEKHRPEFIQLLKKMSDRGQIEFIGGGYYEPIYGLIPKKDLEGQIQMMAERLDILFGKSFDGVWLTERVWDPDLVTPLKKVGVKFTILDDLHFEKAGLSAPVRGYYQTTQGKDTLDLFASMKQLRYLIPFRKAKESIDFIHSTDAKPEDVFVFADDCEKFGLWPGTYDWVYKEGWLDKFLTFLEQDDTITVYTFKEFRKNFAPQSTVKIAHNSYSEMMEWSGGSFYNFLEKYSESRYMRDRMWSVSRQLEKVNGTNGSAEKMLLARSALYRAQCNCSYWHGVFGGLYLHHLRSAVFENLIQAGEHLRQIERKNEKADLPAIRSDELESGVRWRIEQKEIVSFFNGAYGGSLEELDTIPKSVNPALETSGLEPPCKGGVNLMCNLQRRQEPYHEVALKKFAKEGDKSKPLSIHELLGSKEKNLENYLFYDTHRRLSFMDHFFCEMVSPEQFSRCSYEEIGNFIGTPFKTVVQTAESGPELILKRGGAITLHRKKFSVSIKKIISPEGGSSLKVHYLITNESVFELKCVFGVEFNFSIGQVQAMKGLYEKSIKEWIFSDSWRGIGIKLQSKEAMDLIAAPVETISESESGLERTYQELGVLLQRNLILKPKETQEEMLELRVS